MANTILNTQVGYTTSGSNGAGPQSQVIVGRDLSASWEAVGFGPFGRPDFTENVKFNLTLISGEGGNPAKAATISFAAADIMTIIDNSQTLFAPISLTLTEVIICNNGQSGRMMVLASQPYT
jgi:hypothetical protein